MRHELKIGGFVIFSDEYRREHNALVTAIHGDPKGQEVNLVGDDGKKIEGSEYIAWPCINLLYVTSDDSRTDQYGRQIDRPTSICHQGQNSAAGFCYRFVGEDPATPSPTVR